MFDNLSSRKPIEEMQTRKDDEAFLDAVRPGSPKAAWEAYRKRVASRSKKKNKFGEGDLPPQIIGGSPRDVK